MGECLLAKSLHWNLADVNRLQMSDWGLGPVMRVWWSPTYRCVCDRPLAYTLSPLRSTQFVCIVLQCCFSGDYIPLLCVAVYLFCENVLLFSPVESPDVASSRTAATGCKQMLQSLCRGPSFSCAIRLLMLTYFSTPVKCCCFFYFSPLFIMVCIISAPSLDSCGDCVSLSTERQVFLATWKDIPNDNESQFQIKECHLNTGNEGWEIRTWKTLQLHCASASCSFTIWELHVWIETINFKFTLMKLIVFDEISSVAVPIYVR